ncbi:MAG: peptide chain release factor-like protein [Verrucomicrobiales bacterium]|nr:peptide chain release factor-like protein [Verrucomicrobiales bacterium]
MISGEKQRQLELRLKKLGVFEEDLTEKFVTGSGHGGQKINKTSSRVYLKHEPTGLEVQCQAGRSQSFNRHQARVLLCEHLEERNQRDKLEKQRLRAKERYRKRRRSKSQKRRIQADKTLRSVKKQRRRRVGEEN